MVDGQPATRPAVDRWSPKSINRERVSNISQRIASMLDPILKHALERGLDEYGKLLFSLSEILADYNGLIVASEKPTTLECRWDEVPEHDSELWAIISADEDSKEERASIRDDLPIKIVWQKSHIAGPLVKQLPPIDPESTQFYQIESLIRHICKIHRPGRKKPFVIEREAFVSAGLTPLTL